MNLIGNAVEVHAARRPHRDHGRSAKPDKAVLRVRDNGIGIPPELLPKVFDLFVQGDRSLDRTEGGLGIGLTLVKRLVELHGGSVEASSGGRGQGQRIRRPASACAQRDIAPRARRAKAGRRRRRRRGVGSSSSTTIAIPRTRWPRCSR